MSSLCLPQLAVEAVVENASCQKSKTIFFFKKRQHIWEADVEIKTLKPKLEVGVGGHSWAALIMNLEQYENPTFASVFVEKKEDLSLFACCGWCWWCVSVSSSCDVLSSQRATQRICSSMRARPQWVKLERRLWRRKKKMKAHLVRVTGGVHFRLRSQIKLP